MTKTKTTEKTVYLSIGVRVNLNGQDIANNSDTEKKYGKTHKDEIKMV